MRKANCSPGYGEGMSLRLAALCFAAHDPLRLARFWGELLGWDIADDGVATLLPNDDTGFDIRFLPSSAEKIRQNEMHFDLTSQSLADQQQTVARALELGARHCDVGQGPEVPHVVLADPEGNEFCVIEPGNKFLAECGFIGALACDGSQEVGYFWSRALQWPLVWDQDQETAIRSPHGGPKITWGGPPLPAKTGVQRVHYDLALTEHGNPEAELVRLVSLGARLVETRERTDGDSRNEGVRCEGGTGDWSRRATLTDPDGNEFHLWV